MPVMSTMPPTVTNGMVGRPGMRPMPMIATPPSRTAVRCLLTWPMRSEPMSPSVAARVTIRPLATEMSSAGICETRPSPTVSRLYVVAASPGAMPRCTTPIMKPPSRLMIVMMMPAMASPLTNFEAPSIAP
jgi:hypothetical protein